MIKIKEDYRYFTHLIGKESVIPLSKVVAKVFPTRLEIGEVVVDLNLTGPIKGFTHLLNMEKGRVEVFGKAKEGYYHVFLLAKEGKIVLRLHRGSSLSLVIDGKELTLEKGQEQTLLEAKTMPMPDFIEKISFGCSKKALLENDIQRLTKLYYFSQMIPKADALEMPLEDMESLISDLFVPSTSDRFFRGIITEHDIQDKFSVFASLYAKIKTDLVVEEENTLSVLRNSDAFNIAGRGVSLVTENFHVDVLWRKGRVLKVAITSAKDLSKKITFPGAVKKFRVRKHTNEKGKWHLADKPLFCKKNETLFIDRVTY